MRGPRGVVARARELLRESSADNVGSMAAALAYQFLLALFPLAIFMASLGGFMASLFHMQNPTLEVMDRLGTALPGDARSMIQTQVEAVLAAKHPGLLSVGIIGALWSAAGGVGATMKAMNAAYDVTEDRPFWKRTLTSIGLTVFTGLFVLVAFVLAIAGGALISAVANAVGLDSAYRVIAGVVRFAGILALLTAAVSLLYWAGPSVQLPFKWITPGALFFVVAWAAASAGFGFYVSHFGSYNATYGALGGVVVLMVWFYMTAYALLLGAEINALAAKHQAEAARAAEALPVADDAAPRGMSAPKRGDAFVRSRAGALVGSAVAANALWHAFAPRRAPDVRARRSQQSVVSPGR